MQFIRGTKDLKSLNVETFKVIVTKPMMEEYIDTLFSGVDAKGVIVDSIKDRMLEEYLKMKVVDTANTKGYLTRDKIVKFSIITDVSSIECMATLHGKLNRIFY